MVFESVRGYVELASGLTELTRARAMEAAHGLLSLPAAGIATSSKVAVQAGALADELMAAAAANRSNLRALVRSEVDVAVTRLGLVPALKLQEARAEAARLRAEVSRLRSSPLIATSPTSATKKAAPKSTGKVAAPKSAAKKAASKSAAKKVAPKSAAKKVAPPKRATKKVAAPKRAPSTAAASTVTKVAAAPASTATKAAATKSTARKSAVTTRAKPAGA